MRRGRDGLHRERRGLHERSGVLLRDLHRGQVRGQRRVPGGGRRVHARRGLLRRHLHRGQMRVDRAHRGQPGRRRHDVSGAGRELQGERCMLQWSLRAGDRSSGRHEVHRRVQSRRRRLHERAGLLRPRLLRRKVHIDEALHREWRRLQSQCGVLLEPMPRRKVRHRSGELDLPSDRRRLHLGQPARLLLRDERQRPLRQGDEALYPSAERLPRQPGVLPERR